MHQLGRKRVPLILIPLLLFVVTGVSQGQDIDHQKSRKFGIGVQSAPFPVLGASAVININQNLSVQVIGNPFWSVDFVAARFIFRLKRGVNYNFYGYGIGGVFRDDHVSRFLLGPDETDTAPGFGAGGGFEYFFNGLPEIGWNLEAGFTYIDFKPDWYQYDYEPWSLFMVGAGIHYWL